MRNQISKLNGNATPDCPFWWRNDGIARGQGRPSTTPQSTGIERGLFLGPKTRGVLNPTLANGPYPVSISSLSCELVCSFSAQGVVFWQSSLSCNLLLDSGTRRYLTKTPIPIIMDLSYHNPITLRLSLPLLLVTGESIVC